MYFGHHYWGMHLFWWIFWVALVVGLMIWLVPGQPSRRDTAVEALRRQYATGQIDENEYRHRLRVLEGGGDGASAPKAPPPKVTPEAPTHATT